MKTTKLFISPPYEWSSPQWAEIITQGDLPAEHNQEFLEALRSCTDEECQVEVHEGVVLVTGHVASQPDGSFIDAVISCAHEHGYSVKDPDADDANTA